jgi:hypothetical protein
VKLNAFSNIIITALTIGIILVALCIGTILLQSRPHVNLDNYPQGIDYGVLSPKQVEVFDNILNAAQTIEPAIACSTLSTEEQHEILTHLAMYFGAIGDVSDLVRWNNTDATLNLDKLKTLADQKLIIDARVDEAVSTLIEGSDKYKLWQISNYIADKIKYTDGYRNTITALNGKGVCDSYAMLFYKMATRLGIQSYICYGYTSSDGYHAWNMIELDGEQVYFDICWYDGDVRDVRWVFKKNSWDRVFQINNKWPADLDVCDHINN